MANEFEHTDVGNSLTKAEYHAIGGHVFDSQAIGDLLYASSLTQLSRLGITNDRVLISSGGVPVWSAALPAGIGTREFFAAVHYAGGTAAIETTGVLIDAAGEFGYAMILVPQDFTSIVGLEVILVPNATGADMHVDVDTFYGAYNGGEAQNVHGETGNARDIGATINNQNLAHDISDLVDTNPLVAGDFLLVKVAYDATAVATNLNYKGLRLKYS